MNRRETIEFLERLQGYLANPGVPDSSARILALSAVTSRIADMERGPGTVHISEVMPGVMRRMTERATDRAILDAIKALDGPHPAAGKVATARLQLKVALDRRRLARAERRALTPSGGKARP